MVTARETQDRQPGIEHEMHRKRDYAPRFPGPIWTPLIPASFPEDNVEALGKDVPLGRPGEPDEVAPALLFLACEDASSVTGRVIHPNGGTLVGG